MRWQTRSHMIDHELLWAVVTAIIVIGIALGIAFGIVSGINATTANEERAKYNDGVCKACGGHYVYEQAVGHRYSTSYLYRCDGCDAIIEIRFLPETK